jgi:hypothetical protein
LLPLSFISIVLFLSKVPSAKTPRSSEWLQGEVTNHSRANRGTEGKRSRGEEELWGRGAEELLCYGYSSADYTDNADEQPKEGTDEQP